MEMQNQYFGGLVNDTDQMIWDADWRVLLECILTHLLSIKNNNKRFKGRKKERERKNI